MSIMVGEQARICEARIHRARLNRMCAMGGQLPRGLPCPQGLREPQGSLTAVQKSAEGIVGSSSAGLERHSSAERWSNR